LSLHFIFVIACGIGTFIREWIYSRRLFRPLRVSETDSGYMEGENPLTTPSGFACHPSTGGECLHQPPCKSSQKSLLSRTLR
jgi:hypothetical protein